MLKYATVTGLVVSLFFIVTTSPVYGEDGIPWNLTIPPSQDGAHTGRILLAPDSQVHEGPGDTGLLQAAYHLHYRDPESGMLGPAIPLDEEGRILNEKPAHGRSGGPFHVTGGITGETEVLLLAGEWQRGVEALSSQDEPLATPIVPFLMGHAYLALNRSDEAFWLFYTSQNVQQRKSWADWTGDLVRRHPASAGAHYLYGDALARVHKWDQAIASFTESLRLQPDWPLARNARGVVYAINGLWDEASSELDQLSKGAPSFMEGHLSLGTLWVQLRGPEGALEAFRQALEISPHSALGLNGRACARYGLGHWQEASMDLAEAARRSTLPFILQNLRSVSVAAEEMQLCEGAESPLFRATDLLDWSALRQASNREQDLLRKLAGGPLPPLPEAYVIEKLNQALDDPELYDRHQGQFDLSRTNKELVALLKETSVIRKKKSKDLTDQELRTVRRLNRKLIELIYPDLIASHQNRNPGMQLTMNRGLVNQLDYKMSLTPRQIAFGQARMDYVYRPAANLLESTKVPLVRWLGKQWNDHLNQSTRTNNLALTQRYGMSLDQFRPGGVTTDMRRAYVDRGDWAVVAPFGLAYPADSTDGVRAEGEK